MELSINPRVGQSLVRDDMWAFIALWILPCSAWYSFASFYLYILHSLEIAICCGLCVRGEDL